MEIESKPETEFNMSVMTLGRINYSIYLCQQHSRSKDLNSWYFELLNLYMETSTEMKGNLNNVINKYTNQKIEVSDDERDEFQKVEKLINLIEPIVGKWNSSPNSPSLTFQLFKHLMALQMLLMSILKAAGLLMKMKEDLFEASEKWE